MIFLNRRELFLTRDSKELFRVRGCLETNNIQYTIKTNNMTNPGRYHGIPNINSDYAYEYRVFVYKRDYEQAQYAIR